MCKVLGFRIADKATHNSKFGRSNDTFSYDEVSCFGNETSLDECRHENIADCDQGELAGVVCLEDKGILNRFC